MMHILCTGNEKKQTIAWAVKQKWPQTTLASLSSGWNLKFPNLTDRDRFCHEIAKHNVFINSSFIGNDGQSRLLEIVINEWMRENIKGHVITIGTTLEWDSTQIDNPYVKSKLSLRDLSLKYNQQTGITGVKSTYLILGGVNNGQPENKDYLDPMRIADTIEWVINCPDRVGLIHLDAAK